MKNLLSKHLKYAFIIAAIITCSFANAQPHGGAHKGGKQGPPPLPDEQQIEKMVNDMASEIGLSESQKAKVLALHKEHFTEVKEKMSVDTKPDPCEMETLRKNFEEQVVALLSDDQKTKYDAFIEKNHPPRRKPHPEPH